MRAHAEGGRWCSAGVNVIAAAAGSTILPDDPHELSEVLLYFSKLEPQEIKEIGNRGKKFVVENLSYRALGQRFIEGIS